jgi:tRNA1(Val) A37 N6-methylase TrmN6
MTSEKPITVLNGAVSLWQAQGGLKTSTDSVMLAAACPVQSGQSLLDLGCGVGSAGLCVLARVPDIHLTGIDIQADHIELAIKNAVMNGWAEKCDFICGDIRDFSVMSSRRSPGSEKQEKHDPVFHRGSSMLFDHVICNPPYYSAGDQTSPSAAKAKALTHDEPDISIQSWVKCAFAHVKSGGSLTMIHRADSVQNILQALGKSFGRTEIIPLYPKAGQSASRVIIRTLKHRKSPALIHAGVIMHGADSGYSPEAEQILRKIKGLYL